MAPRGAAIETRTATRPRRPRVTPEDRKRLEDERRRSFLRLASHELRTPLNAIIGFSEILTHELYGPMGAPQYREYAGIIHQSGHRLLRLVNQVLEIARLEGGGAELVVRPEPLEPVVDEAIRLIEPDAEAKGLTLAVAPMDGLIAQQDPRALRNALSHLLQNAVAFATEGSTINVRAVPDGEEIRLEVENAGDGVEPRDVPRLMRPFEQGENALTRANEGAGLGWPIVRLLCQGMGGAFRVRSRPGQGLTAVVVLRVAVAAA